MEVLTFAPLVSLAFNLPTIGGTHAIWNERLFFAR